jgi:hypothetical protein
MPAAAPRRSRRVLRIIVREPFGLRLLHHGPGSTVLAELHIKSGWLVVRLACTAAWQRPVSSISAIGYPYQVGPSEQISAPCPSEQDMIAAGGVKDQELTIIVSMLIETRPFCA